jgi:hypothetical protein
MPDQGLFVPGPCWQDLGNRTFGRARVNMAKRAVLHCARLGIVRGIVDFQHRFSAGVIFDLKVAITFSGQQPHAGPKIVVEMQDRPGFAFCNGWGRHPKHRLGDGQRCAERGRQRSGVCANPIRHLTYLLLVYLYLINCEVVKLDGLWVLDRL